MIFKFLLKAQLRRACRQYRAAAQLRRASQPLRLHLGCGQQHLDGFINLDHNPSPATDYVGRVDQLICPPDSVERIEAYHLIEHIPQPTLPVTLKHWLDCLAPGGTLVVECPDLDQAIDEYLQGNLERLYSIYGRQRFPGDAHHWGFNVDRLQSVLASVGFTDIQIGPGQDYHAANEPCLRAQARKPAQQQSPRAAQAFRQTQIARRAA